MRERIRPTRSGLFAIELVAAVGVFILCAAVCVGVIVQAEVMSRDSADLVRAVNEARNAAECFKAADGDLERTAALFGGELQSVGAALSVVQTYDENWNRFYSPQADQTPSAATTADGISYRLCLTPGVRRPVSEESGEFDAPRDIVPGCVYAWLRVVRSDGQSLLDWEVAAWEAAS